MSPLGLAGGGGQPHYRPHSMFSQFIKSKQHSYYYYSNKTENTLCIGTFEVLEQVFLEEDDDMDGLPFIPLL